MIETGFPGGSDSKDSACNAGDLSLIPGSGRSLREGGWQPTLLFLPGEFHGQRSLVGCSPWGHKELDMTEWLLCLLHENMPLSIPGNVNSYIAAAAAKSLQSCPTLCNPIDSNPLRLPPSLGFCRQEHWSGLPFPSPMHESEK